MRFAIFGPSYHKGSSYENYDYVADSLDIICQRYDVDSIRTGGGKGVESMALRYAALQSIEAEITPPNIQRDGDNAFNVRNGEIVEQVDCVLLFWDVSDSKYIRLIKSCATSGTPIIIFGVE